MAVTRAGIIGARGYAGGELLRLLLQHPEMKPTYVTSEGQAGQAVTAGFPTLEGACDLTFSAYDEEQALESADVFFFALPDGEAMQRVEPLLKNGAKVVDLSGDFRLKSAELYERWYGRRHAAAHLLLHAMYGLTETHPEVAITTLVGNPGCYPTAALLALCPLFDRGSGIEPDLNSVNITGLSGISGAGGRAALDPSMSFAAIHDNCRPYSPIAHRHIGEMEFELGREHHEPIPVSFTPHLLPLMRGIIITATVRLLEPTSQDALDELYSGYYAGRTFVRLLTQRLPELKYVVGSNYCEVAIKWDERTQRVSCFAAIDNLVKGAAGSAIQNMNLMLGLHEAEGLRAQALGP